MLPDYFDGILPAQQIKLFFGVLDAPQGDAISRHDIA